MSTLPPIRIASPCNARWSDMTGDERTRVCSHCSKHVYNISEMQPMEVAEMIRAKEGKFCARIYQRRDGTVLTANCPVGKERFVRKIKITLCSVFGAALFFIAARLIQATNADRSRTVTQVERAWDELAWKVKGLFGIQRPAVLLGDVCIPPPPSSTSTNTPNSI